MKMYDDYNYMKPLSEVRQSERDKEGRTRFERMFDDQLEAERERRMLENADNQQNT